MIRKGFIALLAAAGMALSAVAAAQEAVTTRQINVRAGPERDFPLVATLAPGTPVHVNGCVADYIWCDIETGGIRGWVRGQSLQYFYANRYVPLYSYAPTIGLPIIGFSLFSYWDDHYRNRPWYRERPRWEQRWRTYDRAYAYPNTRPAPNYAYPRQEYRQDYHPRIENRPPPQAYVPQQRWTEQQQRWAEQQHRGQRPSEPQFHQRGPIPSQQGLQPQNNAPRGQGPRGGSVEQGDQSHQGQ